MKNQRADILSFSSFILLLIQINLIFYCIFSSFYLPSKSITPFGDFMIKNMCPFQFLTEEEYQKMFDLNLHMIFKRLSVKNLIYKNRMRKLKEFQKDGQKFLNEGSSIFSREAQSNSSSDYLEL